MPKAIWKIRRFDDWKISNDIVCHSELDSESKFENRRLATITIVAKIEVIISLW